MTTIGYHMKSKYHIVLAPKYRRKVFYGEKRREIGKILRTLCNWKKIKIVEAQVCPDHVPMLAEIPPKTGGIKYHGIPKREKQSDALREVSGTETQIWEWLLVVIALTRQPSVGCSCQYSNREFWCRGYCVDTAGRNAQKIQEYIQRQLDEDKAGEQLMMSNF